MMLQIFLKVLFVEAGAPLRQGSISKLMNKASGKQAFSYGTVKSTHFNNGADFN